MTLPEYAACVMNPFDMPPCGYPDVFNKPTLKIKLSESYLLTSDATGMVARQVSPALARSFYTSTTTAGAFVAASYVAHPDYASVTGQACWARVVCIGVSVDYIGPATTASGTLSLITDPTTEYWVGLTPESVMDDGASAPAPEGRRFALVPNMPPRYESDGSITFGQPGFDTAYICATGLPASTACLRVTIIRHVELLPTRSNNLARASATRTKADYAALTALSAVDNVQATSKSWKQELATQTRLALGAVYHAAKPALKTAGEAVLMAAMAGLAI